MAKAKKYDLSKVMSTAWMMVRKYGYTMSEALSQAWSVIKLRVRMVGGVVEFFYKKTDGSIRQAFGTLKDGIVGAVKGTGRVAPMHLQTYWDTEVEEWRSFKMVNLLSVA